MVEIIETSQRSVLPQLIFNTGQENFDISFIIIIIIIIITYLLTAVGLLPGGSGWFTCIRNMKLVTTNLKSGGLHEKHVVATLNLGSHLSICF